ncbi:RNA-directed DNA polymerase from mobile element jockey [Stylophora pistillata]|uniref:RNA-directed DNA polymerase from mobile element jockey n=1 Tax=Stylophora pistillata TaxID=50429 RepID=A0A2B4QZS5_STYPI|nr:RNA-directed DNA polymerase from mobile element jockey [Stylophora pistillata]
MHSTLTALLEATNSWYLNIDDGLINSVLFLDLKKAFDTVDHSILSKKLQLYGLGPHAVQWSKSYLSNRFQSTFLNGTLSDYLPVSCGVPQGSVLGPLLFLIYIHDLQECELSSSALIYADDTSLTLSAYDPATLEEKLNKDLDEVQKWLKSNKLRLNVKKAKCMIIGSYYRLRHLNGDLNVTVNSQQLTRVTHYRYLGIEVDEALGWQSHVDAICKMVPEVLEGRDSMEYLRLELLGRKLITSNITLFRISASDLKPIHVALCMSICTSLYNLLNSQDLLATSESSGQNLSSLSILNDLLSSLLQVGQLYAHQGAVREALRQFVDGVALARQFCLPYRHQAVTRTGKRIKNVIVDITFPCGLSVFVQSCCEVSASLCDVGGLAVGAIDLINCSLSFPWFFLLFNVEEVLDQVNSWSLNNRLVVHEGKSKAMILSTKPFIGPLKPLSLNSSLIDGLGKAGAIKVSGEGAWGIPGTTGRSPWQPSKWEPPQQQLLTGTITLKLVQWRFLPYPLLTSAVQNAFWEGRVGLMNPLELAETSNDRYQARLAWFAPAKSRGNPAEHVQNYAGLPATLAQG